MPSCVTGQAEMHAPSATMTIGDKPPYAPCCDCPSSFKTSSESARRSIVSLS